MNRFNKKVLIIVLTAIVLIGGFAALAYFKKLPTKQIQIAQQDAAGQEQKPIEQLNTQAQQAGQTPEQDAQVQSQQPQAKLDAQENNSSTIEKQTADSTKTQSKTQNQVAQSQTKTDGKIISRPVSWGFQKAPNRNIKAVIIHTTYNNLGGDPFDFDKVVQEWKDAGVSPHYAIDRDGKIYQLVADQNIAYHAGVSKLPDGTTDVNGASIGIEVVNSQDAKFTDAQYSALNYLIGVLEKRYSIKYVLGHDDIAPGRKSDPWGIDWSKVQK